MFLVPLSSGKKKTSFIIASASNQILTSNTKHYIFKLLIDMSVTQQNSFHV
jgi:hypothetical protein